MRRSAPKQRRRSEPEGLRRQHLPAPRRATSLPSHRPVPHRFRRQHRLPEQQQPDCAPFAVQRERAKNPLLSPRGWSQTMPGGHEPVHRRVCL